jgi:hypothetical protein
MSWWCMRLRCKHVTQPAAFVVPALRKHREGQGTRFVGDAIEIKKPGPRPSSPSRRTNCRIHCLEWAAKYGIVDPVGKFDCALYLG